MILPTIHLNGTSAQSLFEAAVEACSAINKAGVALRETTPNGRDYYPQGGDAISQAMNEHEARLAKLRSLLVDMQTLAQHCQQFIKE